MPSLNKVILIGNLVADPELKTTSNGLSVTSFRIGVQRRFAKDSAQQQTDFINIVCWRQTAEFVTRYFTKGRPILVCGSLQSRSYTDKDGNQRTAYEVVADEVSFVDKKTDREVSQYGNSPAFSTPNSDSAFEDISSDDALPF